MTLDEIIAEIKAENPTLRKGSEEAGYQELTAQEYEATIAEWAGNRFAKLEKIKAEAEALAEAEQKKSAAAAKLEALGLDVDDLKALGLA